MKRRQARGSSAHPHLCRNRRAASLDRGMNPLPRNAPDLEQAKSEPPHVERDEGRRFSSRTTRIRGSSSMTSCPMILTALFAEVSLGRPPTMAITLFPITHTPKPTTRDPLGKISTETVYHGDSARKSGAYAKNREGLGKNRNGSRLSWRFPQEKAGISPKPATHERLGEIPNGTCLSWRSRFIPTALTPKPANGLGKILTVSIFGDVEFYTHPAKPKSKGSPANCHDIGAGSAAPPGFSILRSPSPQPDATD